MKKRKIHITLRTNSCDTEYNLLGEYDSEHKILTYFESSSFLTKVTIDMNKQELIRDNKECRIIFQFQVHEITKNFLFLKEINQDFLFRIKTQKFFISEHQLEILYILLDSQEEVSYQIEF